MNKYSQISLITAFAAFGASNALGSVIFFEDFSGLDTTPLNGSTPTTTVDGKTWAAGTELFKDGNLIDSGIGSAYLTLDGSAALTTNTSYVMSAELVLYNSSTNWVSMGFFDTANTDLEKSQYFADGEFFVARSNGGTVAFTSQGDVTTASLFTPEYYSVNTSAAPVLLQVFLTTGSDLSSGTSTISMAVDGNYIDLNGAVAGNEMTGVVADTLDAVGFSNGSTFGNFQSINSFTWETATIPELSSFAALGGLVGLLAVATRRKRN